MTYSSFLRQKKDNHLPATFSPFSAIIPNTPTLHPYYFHPPSLIPADMSSSQSQERQPRRQKKQQQQVVEEESESDSGSEEQYEPPKRSNRRSRQQNNQMQQRNQQGPMNQMGGGMPGQMGNMANQAMQQQQPQGGGGGGKSDTLRLRLDLNLDIEITLKAKIHGDLELALLYVLTLFIVSCTNPLLLSCHPAVWCHARGRGCNLPPSGWRSPLPLAFPLLFFWSYCHREIRHTHTTVQPKHLCFYHHTAPHLFCI